MSTMPNPDLPTVNRNALVVEPTAAYAEWARSCSGGDPEIVDDMLADETGAVYLIPEVEDLPDAWLKRNYRAILENELFAWHTDEVAWPTDRSFKMFQSFFTIRFKSMVMDMGTTPIERDAE